MEYNFLPSTRIKVSKICLGTMTWGRQNTIDEAFEQMNYSLENGVNFFDTAELYPVPATPDKYADTEKIIGHWFNKFKKRDKIILATKIAGPGAYTQHIRKTGFKGNSIVEAVNGSLKRLQTDYIDLYQLHWPERITNTFGNRSLISLAFISRLSALEAIPIIFIPNLFAYLSILDNSEVFPE